MEKNWTSKLCLLVWSGVFFKWNLNIVNLLSLEHTLEQLLCHILKNMKGGRCLGQTGLDSQPCFRRGNCSAMPFLSLSSEVTPLGTQQTAKKACVALPCLYGIEDVPGLGNGRWPRGRSDLLHNGALWGVRGQESSWEQLKEDEVQKGGQGMPEPKAPISKYCRGSLSHRKGDSSPSSAAVGAPKPKKSGSSFY